MNIRRFSGGAAALAAALLLAGPALADGYKRGSLKDAKPEPRRCNLSANVALTTEYVFRGYSQTAEGAAVQGGFDVTCGIFYAGVWASSLNWDAAPVLTPFGQEWASVEMDWYLGVKPVTGPITWDIGVIYYSYPNSVEILGVNNDYVELKVGASVTPWKDGTLGLTVYYSPDYQYETGPVWTVEGTVAQVLPKVSIFTPTISAVLGYQGGDDVAYAALVGNGDDHYWYWNAGITLGFHEKFSLDFRYWDTSLSDNAGGSAWCTGPAFQCDERFVATLKFTF
jgi:uncharacterized protein (TIGR02001 family)